MLLMTSSSCSPVENGLHCGNGRLNGPLSKPSRPSGKKGRERLPPARSEKAMPSASAVGPTKFWTAVTKPAMDTPNTVAGVALRSAAAAGVAEESRRARLL